ncbi:MAG: aldehyde dehydrogenase family protein, partial [Pseudonocardiaceae bacterium]
MTESLWTREHMYAGGRWVNLTGTPTEVEDPATERPVGSVLHATAAETAQAVDCAHRAADSWMHTPAPVRRKLLHNLAQALRDRTGLLIDTLVAEIGCPIGLAESSQFGQAMAVLDSYVEILEHYEFEQRIANTTVIKEPAGVVAAITPWNYPLYQLVNKVAPALAAGCTVVAKPAELTPLSAFILADAVHEVGFPAGVFNLVPGTGAEVGTTLTRHPAVDVVSFTGSTGVGRHILQNTAHTIK